MIQIGQKCPEFELPALKGHDFSGIVRLDDYAGKWLMIYFYPIDFSPLCPTELKAFSDAVPSFRERDCAVIGGSCDSVYAHLGWVTAKEELKGMQHPLFADHKRELASALGVLDAQSGFPQRATLLIDPQGIVRFIYVTDLAVGRSTTEILRVLDALQTGEYCPCNWKKGDQTIGK
ncbi:redoxin domain-containing protein [bacterium]|nr:redoxin domain-containing protein [bacterium]